MFASFNRNYSVYHSLFVVLTDDTQKHCLPFLSLSHLFYISNGKKKVVTYLTLLVSVFPVVCCQLHKVQTFPVCPWRLNTS